MVLEQPPFELVVPFLRSLFTEQGCYVTKKRMKQPRCFSCLLSLRVWVPPVLVPFLCYRRVCHFDLRKKINISVFPLLVSRRPLIPTKVLVAPSPTPPRQQPSMPSPRVLCALCVLIRRVASVTFHRVDSRVSVAMSRLSYEARSRELEELGNVVAALDNDCETETLEELEAQYALTPVTHPTPP